MNSKETIGILVLAGFFTGGVLFSQRFSAEIIQYLDFGTVGMAVYVLAGIVDGNCSDQHYSAYSYCHSIMGFVYNSSSEYCRVGNRLDNRFCYRQEIWTTAPGTICGLRKNREV